MINIDLRLWEQFETTGKIDDYLAYKLSAKDLEEEQENAYNNRWNSNS